MEAATTRKMTDAEVLSFENGLLKARLKRSIELLKKVPIRTLRDAGMSWTEINKLSS